MLMLRSSLALDYEISESYNVCLFQTKGKMINYLHLVMIICHFSCSGAFIHIFILLQNVTENEKYFCSTLCFICFMDIFIFPYLFCYMMGLGDE